MTLDEMILSIIQNGGTKTWTAVDLACRIYAKWNKSIAACRIFSVAMQLSYAGEIDKTRDGSLLTRIRFVKKTQSEPGDCLVE